jgi:hypothetical protein
MNYKEYKYKSNDVLKCLERLGLEDIEDYRLGQVAHPVP